MKYFIDKFKEETFAIGDLGYIFFKSLFLGYLWMVFLYQVLMYLTK